MASVEGMSDGEIRVRLTELGYPVGPITATTRKVLVKKLKYLLEQGKSPVKDAKNRSSLSRYSSEEEGEDDVTARTQDRGSMPPPKTGQKLVKRKSLTRRSQDKDNHNLDDNTISHFQHPTASSTFLNSTDTGLVLGSQNKYSPKNILSPNNINTDRTTSSPNHAAFSTFSTNFQSKYRSYKSQEPYDTGSDTDGLDEIESKGHSCPSKASSTVYSSFIPSFGSGSQARSRFQTPLFGGISNEGAKYSPKISTSSDINSHNSPSPFSSDFVRRLSAASSNRAGISSGLPSRLLDVKESDDEDITSAPTYTHQNTGTYRRGTVSSLEGKIWRNATTISMVLLLVVIVFFCIIAVLYLNVGYKEMAITTTDTNLPICNMGGKPGADCVLSSEIQPAMNMFNDIRQLLHERAVQYTCNGRLKSPALTEEELTQLVVQKKQAMSVWDVEKYFGNIKVLIRANPQWGVEIKEKAFQISSPALPIKCYLLSFCYGIIGSTVQVVFVLALAFGVWKGILWWSDRQECTRKEVFKMVESIINILSTHQESSTGDNFLAISHVRDQLIPPHQRDKMANIWNKAVSYLEENESRVRTEVQQVLGEEFRVWRWLPAPRTNGKRKVWQGQAFETIEGSVNSLTVSPTPCLKIRHMFDSDMEAGEDWMIRVQDAILEKCDGVNVLHVAVDKNSNEGCVYVKCASSQDAGRAYRALHGSWFDNKLVTVKYLRLERYHERFPEAARSVRPLRPSNDRKLSLQ